MVAVKPFREKTLQYNKRGDKLDVRHLDSSFTPIFKTVIRAHSIKELATLIKLFRDKGFPIDKAYTRSIEEVEEEWW